MPRHIAVGLARLAGHFRQLPVGCKADRAGDMRTDIVRDARLDPAAQGFRRIPVGDGDTAGQFVDGLDRIDCNDSGNLRNQRIVGAAIEIGRLRHEDDLRASLPRLGDGHDVLDAAQLCLAGAGDDAGVPGLGERHDTATGLPRKCGCALLFDGGKEAIKVKIQPFNLGWPTHAIGSRG
jgi:hypothetical protein